MLKRNWMMLTLVVLAMMFVACSAPAPTATPVPPPAPTKAPAPAVEPTKAPVATSAPTAVPTKPVPTSEPTKPVTPVAKYQEAPALARSERAHV